MATTAAPYGLKPVGLLGGRPYTGTVRQVPISSAYGTSIFNGDVVYLAGGYCNKSTDTSSITSGKAPVGVFLGCSYTDPVLGFVQRQYWPASTATVSGTPIVAYVCDDPDAVFQVQSSGSIAQATQGYNVPLVQNSGSTATGDSKVAVGSAATTNTLPLKIVDFVNGPFSAVGDSYTDVLVVWNGVHAYRTALGNT